MMKQSEIQGIIPPIPTPFDGQQELALEQLQSNLERWNQCGYSGYLVLGSTGEFVHLSEFERLSVLDAARQAIPDDLLLIAGCSLQSTYHSIEFIRQVARLGVSAVLVNTPGYYKQTRTPTQLVQYYQTVADAAPVPILLYNAPQFTGVTLPPQTVAQLAEHANIWGIKDSSGNITGLANILHQTPESFRVLSGSASTFYPALSLGAQGGILAVACVAWEACLELMRAALEGEPQRAREVQLRLLPVAAAVTTWFGIGGLKTALQVRGFHGGPPRAPLPAADEAAIAEIKQILQSSGLMPALDS